jgi:hypothetical protein
MRPREGAAKHLTAKAAPLPAPPGSNAPGVYPQAFLSLESSNATPKEAVRWLFGTFERHVLRRVDAVNAQYLPKQPAGDPFPLRDDFHLLPWADKKRLKRLAYKLANLMKSEFMREFDFQYEKTADVEFSTLYAYGYIASKAMTLNIAIPGWGGIAMKSWKPKRHCVPLRAFSRKVVVSKIRRIHDCWREHLMIAAGYVSKVASPLL